MEGEHVHLHCHLASILNMCDRVYLGLVVSYTSNCTKEARKVLLCSHLDFPELKTVFSSFDLIVPDLFNLQGLASNCCSKLQTFDLLIFSQISGLLTYLRQIFGLIKLANLQPPAPLLLH